MHPPEGPPVCTPFIGRLPRMPPPMPNTMSRRVMPKGISTRPVFFTAPTSENTVVPRFRSLPRAAYQAAPR